MHVVLEEAPAQSASSESREWQLLLWSAKSERALEQMTANLCEHLKHAREEEKLADVAYTLQVGRRGFITGGCWCAATARMQYVRWRAEMRAEC